MILIVASILIGISVSVLEPNEVGLKFSGVSLWVVGAWPQKSLLLPDRQLSRLRHSF